jgi:hypothetical protein
MTKAEENKKRPLSTASMRLSSQGMTLYTTTRRHRASPLLFLFNRDNFLPIVVAAVRTDGVRRAHLTAVAAGDEWARRQGVVRAAPVAAAFGVFTFRVGRHFGIPLSDSDGIMQNNACREAWQATK